MAKRIKAVQCPQCGSAQQTKIEQDHYRCQSCGAEYFIDNDDINVNVRHQYNTTQRTPTKTPIAAIIGSIISVLVVFSIMIYTAIGGGGKSTSNSPLSTGTITSPISNDIAGAALPLKSKEDISFFISKRTYGKWNEEDARNGYYAIFFDLTKKEILKESKLEATSVSRSSIGEYKSRHFKSMGKTYVILNKTKIYDVDFEQMSVRDVTVEMFSGFEDYQAGLSVIEFVYDNYGDGFKLVTNLGKNLIFYPGVRKSYNKDEAYESGQGWKTLEPGAKEETYYLFTKRSSDYPEKLIQLLEVTYMNNGGGPEDKLNHLSWRKDYSSSVGGYAPPSLVTKYQMDRSRVKKYTDITPERVYFEAEVLYHRAQENDLLIMYKPTLAPDAPLIFQLVDLETKEPKWTVQTTDDIYVKDVSLTDKHFVILKYSKIYYFLPLEGGKMTSYELPYR